MRIDFSKKHEIIYDGLQHTANHAYIKSKQNIISQFFSNSPFTFFNRRKLKNRIQFLGGNEDMRSVEFGKAPDLNDCLIFRVSDWWNNYSRIQLAFYEPATPSKVLRLKVGMYLDEDWDLLKSLPDDLDDSWGPVIFELFNEPVWIDTPYKFRINVRIKNDKGKLRFTTYAQTKDDDGKYHTIWEHDNHSFDIQTGRWINLEYLIADGVEYGRFIMNANYREQSYKTEVFNVYAPTRHPDKEQSDGFTHWQPIKMYSSRNLTQFFKDNRKEMITYWDKLEMISNSKT